MTSTYVFLSLLFVCCLSQIVFYPESSGKRLRSAITNNSFEFKVYKDHPRFPIDTCFDTIFGSYTCQAKERAHSLIKNYIHGKNFDADFNWLYNDYASVRNMEECHSEGIYCYGYQLHPATRLYIASSGAFSWAISRGSPGIWGCFVDSLVEEYNDLLESTKVVEFLYSGISNTLSCNLTDKNGKINVGPGDAITVSGYFSTTSNKEVAVQFANWHSTFLAYPAVLVIKTLANNSKGAYIGDIVDNDENETLFPTNVRFIVTDVYDKNDERMDEVFRNNGIYYQIMVDEAFTESIQTEVDGQDPLLSICVSESSKLTPCILLLLLIAFWL